MSQNGLNLVHIDFRGNLEYAERNISNKLNVFKDLKTAVWVISNSDTGHAIAIRKCDDSYYTCNSHGDPCYRTDNADFSKRWQRYKGDDWKSKKLIILANQSAKAQDIKTNDLERTLRVLTDRVLEGRKRKYLMNTKKW